MSHTSPWHPSRPSWDGGQEFVEVSGTYRRWVDSCLLGGSRTVGEDDCDRSPHRHAKAPQAVSKGARCCQRKRYVDHWIDRVQLDVAQSGCIDAPSHSQGKVSTTATAPSSYCHPNRMHTRQAGPRTHVRLVSNGAAASPEIVEARREACPRELEAALRSLRESAFGRPRLACLKEIWMSVRCR